jgi:excisionase family DNA binding protein
VPVQKKIRRRSNTLTPERSFEERKGVLMTFAEAADWLGVKELAVEKLVRAGELPVTLIGERTRRIHVDDLRVYVETHRVVGRRER